MKVNSIYFLFDYYLVNDLSIQGMANDMEQSLMDKIGLIELDENILESTPLRDTMNLPKERTQSNN